MATASAPAGLTWSIAAGRTGLTDASGVGLAVGEGDAVGVAEAAVADGPDFALPPEQPVTTPTASATAAAPTQARRDVVGPMRMPETYREADISVSRTAHLVDDRDPHGTVVATQRPCASDSPGRVPRAIGAAGGGHVARVCVPGAHRVRTC